MPTPQLAEKPKARLMAGLRRIALRPDQLAQQFIDAWPTEDNPSIPDRFAEQENEFAWQDFWEDVDENWGNWGDAEWYIQQYNEGENEHVKFFVEVTEKALEEDEEEWYPISTALEHEAYDILALYDEWWFPKLVNEIIPANNDLYMNLLAYHIADTGEAEQWADMKYSPPGIGTEIAGEEDIVIATKRTADVDAEDAQEQKEIGRAFMKSDTFRNWFLTSSRQTESPLPEDFTFSQLLTLALEIDNEALGDTLESVFHDAEDLPESGLKAELDDLMSIEDRIKKYTSEADTIDKDKIKKVMSESFQSTIEEMVAKDVEYRAHNRFKYELAEELELDTHEDSPYPEIGQNIASKLGDGSLTPEHLVQVNKDHDLFVNGGWGNDFKEVGELLDSWDVEIDDETIHFDDEDYARVEQQKREHKLWLEQRRNRTPEGNVYDVGDQVLYSSNPNPMTVTEIEYGRITPNDWYYNIADGEYSSHWVSDSMLMPAPPPQQEVGFETTTASILDEPAETLDPFIFDLSEDQTAPKIHDDVREQILSQLGKAQVNPDAIRAVLFFGSAAAYQYDPDTDFDIAVVVDPSLTRQGEEILGLNREISDEIFIAGHPVTYFFREDDYPVEGSDAIYDLIGNFWIRVPERSESAMSHEDYSDTIDDATEWAKVLDAQIGELRRDVIDYEKLQGAYQRASDERKMELYDKVQDVVSQLNEDVASLANEKDELQKTRAKAFQQDLEELGEDAVNKYLSRNWIPENVIYKVLERYRYVQLLKMMDKLNKEGLFDDQNQLKLEYNAPIKSAMDKLEDEIDPGDLMEDRRTGHDVVVEDISDAGEEYKYEIYDTVDDRGQLDEVEKMDLIMVDENPDRLLPKENPEIKTGASGGTGYGDYQEKITDTSGSSMAGDVSGSHAPDVAPQEPDSREGPPVPSEEFMKSQQRTEQVKHRSSVAMRRVNALATEVVGIIRLGQHRAKKRRQAQVDHNTGSDQNSSTSDFIDKTLRPNPGSYQNQNVAGQPLGGGYSTNETQQAEQPTGEASEEENLAATQQNYDSSMQGKELAEQVGANDMTQQYQLRMMGAAVEEKKLQVIMGSSVGAEDPADSSVNQMESSDDGRFKSKTDEGRKVLLHERDEDDKGENATFPKVDDQLKPLP